MALVNFSGIASGIDSTALIKALLDQERAVKINPLENTIASLEDTNSAFGELSTLLANLASAAAKFRSVSGGPLAKLGTSSDEGVASVTAGPGATNGSYTLTVTNLAKNATYSFGERYASTSDPISGDINPGESSNDRTVTVTVGSGSEQEEIEIELTDTTSVAEFIESFNSQSELATASAVNVGTASSPSYAIVITSLNEGTDLGSISTSTGTHLTSLGVLQHSGATVDDAEDAEFSIDGIGGSITRSSNSVSDVIPGLTLQLNDLGSTKIAVTTDSGATAANLQEFVDAYNEVVRFIAEYDAVTQEEDGGNLVNIFGALANSSLDESVLSSLREALTGAGISGGLVNVLADLGVTTNRDGTLAFDTAVFEDALADDPLSAGTILGNLGEDLAAIDGRIAQFTRFNGLIDVAEQANTSRITELNTRIAETEASLAQREESLIKQYARLESLIGQLNSMQSSLSSILPAS